MPKTIKVTFVFTHTISDDVLDYHYKGMSDEEILSAYRESQEFAPWESDMDTAREEWDIE